jgi:hypothetical protein
MPEVITVAWVTGAEAQRATGYGTKMLRKLVQEGKIGVFKVPGMPTRYRRSDIEKLLAEYTRPARAEPAAA